MTPRPGGDLRIGLHIGQLLQRVPGGIGRYAYQLLLALRALGADVVPFAAGDPSMERIASWPGYVDLGHPHAPFRYELWHRLRWPRVRVAADLVHAPSLAVPPTRLPLVVTVNDVAFLHHPDAFTPHGVAFHRRGLDIARREARAVVVPTQFIGGELVDQGFAPTRIFVAHHGVAPPPAVDADAIEQRIRRVAVEEPYVLAVGTIEPRKNLPLVVAAVEQLRRSHEQVRVVLAGPRGWLDVPDLDRGWVRELGAVDDATLDALYRRAVALAMPSRYEGFGLPVLEAMARGCPVIAADATSLPEVVGDAGLLVTPHDVDAWASTIEALMGDPGRRDELASRGRARAQVFTWGESARAHLEAFTAAVASSGS